MTEIAYPGDELRLFAHAQRWRRYWMSHVEEFVAQRTLEVGAGIGSVTRLLASGAESVIALEPDPDLCGALNQLVHRENLTNVDVVQGTLQDLEFDGRFDCVIYADVLEHIETDAEELAAASQHLNPGGHLVVLVPAHQWLYSPFDAQVGHYRRYSRQRLVDISPPGMRMLHLHSLDCAGLALSGGNRMLLKSATPTPQQVGLWDRYFVPISRVVDPILNYRFGKSHIVIWRREDDGFPAC